MTQTTAPLHPVNDRIDAYSAASTVIAETNAYSITKSVLAAGNSITLTPNGTNGTITISSSSSVTEGTGIGCIIETASYGVLTTATVGLTLSASALISGGQYQMAAVDANSMIGGQGSMDWRVPNLTGIFTLRAMYFTSLTTVFGVGYFYVMKWERTA